MLTALRRELSQITNHVQTGNPRKYGTRPWVRIASSVLLGRCLLKRNKPLAKSTLEAVRAQVV